ncbi:MAG: CerR family C-terminal domain-containing protein [Blastocatellia bacterium]
MARTKTDDPEARAKIAAAAEELFAARGFDGTAIRDIARKAAVNGAMIHYYFGSKEGLYRAILEGAASKVRALLVETTSRGASTRDRLSSFVDAYTSYVLKHPDLARILYREMLMGGKHIREIAQKHAVTNYGILRDTIADGVRKGELRPIDTELAPVSLMGMIVIFQFLRPIISAALGKKEYDNRFVERIAAHSIDLFLNGVVADGSPRQKHAAATQAVRRSTKRGAKAQK